MRFEQLLEKTKRLADPAWRDKWLDYKVRRLWHGNLSRSSTTQLLTDCLPDHATGCRRD